MTRELILKFLYKFFFILKAASNGIIVRYLGGDQFEFSHLKKNNASLLIKKCSENLPMFLLNK